MPVEPKEEPKSGAPAWMCTFADLMSLLLTFFVLLLSMSSTEAAKFRAMAGSLRDAFGMKSDFALSPTSMSDEILPHDDERQGDASADDELERELREALEELGVDTGDMKMEGDDSVLLRLDGDLLFASGEARLKPKALPVLDAVAKYLNGTNYVLDVVGYTDNVPISTPVFPSNWELSAARAGQAVRRLSEQGVAPERLRAIGRAETEPIAGNDTPQGRSKNRRVEFNFTRPQAPEQIDFSDVERVPQSADSREE